MKAFEKLETLSFLCIGHITHTLLEKLLALEAFDRSGFHSNIKSTIQRWIKMWYNLAMHQQIKCLYVMQIIATGKVLENQKHHKS